MAKAATILCPNCRETIKTGQPIGTVINVRSCGECDHTYYVQALDETHCRVSASASLTRIGYEEGQGWTTRAKFKAKTTFHGGGRTAGKAYKATKDFYTKFAEKNQDFVVENPVVEEVEFEEVSPFEEEGDHADEGWLEYLKRTGFKAGVDFSSGEDKTGFFIKRDPFMPEGGPWEPTQEFEQSNPGSVGDRAEFLTGKWVDEAKEPHNQGAYMEELVKYYEGRGLSKDMAAKAAETTVKLHNKQGVPTPNQTWREKILRGEWIVAEPNRQSPEEIKEKFDRLRAAADKLREATEKLTQSKTAKPRNKKG